MIQPYKKRRKDLSDDLSKNKGKSIRYRVRLQEDRESKQELKDFKKYKDYASKEI